MNGYQIEIIPDDNDTFFVTCPALPEVTTFGETREDATINAIGAIEEALASRLERWAEIPALEDGTNVLDGRHFVPLPTQAVAKVLLYRLLRERGVTRAELHRRLHVHREQVDRLFRLDHASRMDQFDAAFKALGVHLALTLEEDRSSKAA